MNTSTPGRPRRRGTWIVVLFGLLEIGAVVAFFELKGFASAVCVATGAVQGVGSTQAALGGAAPGGAGAPQPADTSAAMLQQAVTAAPVPQPEGSAPALSAPAQAGAAAVSGDTNQIVDPNCVGKTVSGMLSSSDTPPAGPTCGPMKQPPELKAAEQQISH